MSQVKGDFDYDHYPSFLESKRKLHCKESQFSSQLTDYRFLSYFVSQTIFPFIQFQFLENILKIRYQFSLQGNV